MSLTFDALRRANAARLPMFKNARGEPAHSQPDGSDWSLGEWCNAVLGELGEAANIIKKVHRGDLTLDEARPALGKEFADVVTYLDILAMRAGVDLGKATRAKWNEVSIRVGVPLRIDDNGVLAELTPQVRPWEAITEEERHAWAPRGPYSFVTDGDDEKLWYVVLGPDRRVADTKTFSHSRAGARDASRYVAWANREHATAQTPVVAPA
jgi:NTP pyrophosphatase (non-canonical NTP hydrolase)